MNHIRPRQGSALIEVIVAISIAALIVPPIFGLIQYAGRLSANAKMRTRAVTHAKAALEALTAQKNLRWGDFDTIPPIVNSLACPEYVYPSIVSNEWKLHSLTPTGGWEPIGNGLQGRLCLIKVLRDDATGKISPLGSGAPGTLNDNFIQAISQVQWDDGGAGKSVQLTTHITNWHAAP